MAMLARSFASRLPKAASARLASRALSSGQKEWVPDVSVDTQLVHGGINPCEKTGAILTPVYMSTTFVQESVDKYLEKGFSYSRTNNPTVSELEAKVALIEGGYGSICVSTGMSATASCINGFMNAGDHCVMTNCSYGGTNRIAREQFMPLGMEFSFVDFTDLDAVKAAIKPNTKLIFSESPTNPTLNLADLGAISEIAKEAGVLHVCDSTFATPYICKPLDHGADLTIQSLTKYYDGHNIGVGGALISSTQELWERTKLIQNMHGNILSPMTAFMMLQSMKTMGLRVTRQSESAMKICTFLESHPNVEKCVYPGLASHPQKELADRQHMNGLHGGMAWFDVVGGDTAAIKLMDNIKRPWTLCENLGATESIITACAVMTHANMLREDRLKAGISDGFIRISVGIEDPDDLIRSLDEALNSL
uniref:plant cystathionine gamma-synthase n=1 Tax=Trieres chinensis TaxID=1514140 RepID=A0A7S1ZIH0_TRICV|eukprot:CAMPEP_0183296690 /NCGR_PEP_ID=MMETSP0160_2-20130417/4147_1 /TAXON_ID=2839 ORGANISM="Odontella Sinensis, Strain Grunow 1884" /NCGR_SAMPLE_ID=MMETSP0160_2 /ASSEMBLY_ACC=CAM_ASM_000250 /LENGTH=421 /DNA_ID=CAMNT_0025458347 /DNA_START=18 /DNA_END=1283 /DNA_ORIENTATION=+